MNAIDQMRKIHLTKWSDFETYCSTVSFVMIRISVSLLLLFSSAIFVHMPDCLYQQPVVYLGIVCECGFFGWDFFLVQCWLTHNTMNSKIAKFLFMFFSVCCCCCVCFLPFSSFERVSWWYSMWPIRLDIKYLSNSFYLRHLVP